MNELRYAVVTLSLALLVGCGASTPDDATGSPASGEQAPSEQPTGKGEGEGDGPDAKGPSAPAPAGGTVLWEQRLDLKRNAQLRTVTGLVALSAGVTLFDEIIVGSGRIFNGGEIPQPEVLSFPSAGGAPTTTLVDAWKVSAARAVDDAVAYHGTTAPSVAGQTAYYEEVLPNGTKRKRHALPAPAAWTEKRLLAAQGRFARVSNDSYTWTVTRFSAAGVSERTETLNTPGASYIGSLHGAAMSDAGAIAVAPDGFDGVLIVPVSGARINHTMPLSVYGLAYAGTRLLVSGHGGTRSIIHVVDAAGKLESACEMPRISEPQLARASNGDVYVAGWMNGLAYGTRAVVRRINPQTCATVWERAVDEIATGEASCVSNLTQASDGSLYAAVVVGQAAAVVVMRLAP